MAQKPQSQLSFRPGKMSEESEFVLRELYEEITNLRHDLKMDVDGGPAKEILRLTQENDNLIDEVNTLKTAQAVLEDSVLKLQQTVIALTQKLDENSVNVTGLENNYSTEINPNLY